MGPATSSREREQSAPAADLRDQNPAQVIVLDKVAVTKCLERDTDMRDAMLRKANQRLQELTKRSQAGVLPRVDATPANARQDSMAEERMLQLQHFQASGRFPHPWLGQSALTRRRMLGARNQGCWTGYALARPPRIELMSRPVPVCCRHSARRCFDSAFLRLPHVAGSLPELPGGGLRCAQVQSKPKKTERKNSASSVQA